VRLGEVTGSKLIFEFDGEPSQVAEEFAEFARIMGPLIAPALAEIGRKKDREE